MFISYRKHQKELEEEAKYWKKLLEEIYEAENKRFIDLNKICNHLMDANEKLQVVLLKKMGMDYKIPEKYKMSDLE